MMALPVLLLFYCVQLSRRFDARYGVGEATFAQRVTQILESIQCYHNTMLS